MGRQTRLLIFRVRANCLFYGYAARRRRLERPILLFCLATAQKQTSEQQAEQIVESSGEQEFGTRKTHDLFHAIAPMGMVAVLRAVLASRFRPSVAGHVAFVVYPGSLEKGADAKDRARCRRIERAIGSLGDRVGQKLAAFIADANRPAGDFFEIVRLEPHRRFHGVMMLVPAIDEHEGGQRLEVTAEFDVH